MSKKIKRKRRFIDSLVYYLIVALGFFAIYKRQWIMENRRLAEYGALGFICFFILFHLFIQYLKRRSYLNSPLSKIDNMTGEEFEEYLKARFERQGYKVELTPGSNDYGADLILTKNGEITVVQAKRYQANVGNKAVQEIVAAQAYYGAVKAMVVTNSYFTNPAIKLAEANDVELWDRDRLASKR
ncbi:MAG: restriction endonuclease [Lachnospiraceae bacterium]|nr:restriction endonuclease [Lachnospiraceae bacterium]